VVPPVRPVVGGVEEHALVLRIRRDVRLGEHREVGDVVRG
jgi:hypothetical protein